MSHVIYVVQSYGTYSLPVGLTLMGGLESVSWWCPCLKGKFEGSPSSSYTVYPVSTDKLTSPEMW